WRKANNFRELVVFLLSCVATIKLANTKLYLDIFLYICYYSSHYVCRYLSHHLWWQNVYAASAARVVSRPWEGPPPHGVVYLSSADHDHRLPWPTFTGAKSRDEGALPASQRPSPPCGRPCRRLCGRTSPAPAPS